MPLRTDGGIRSTPSGLDHSLWSCNDLISSAVNGNDHGLRTELVRSLSDKVRSFQRRRTNRHLIRAVRKQPANVLDIANPSSDCDRAEQIVTEAFDLLKPRPATVLRGADIQQDQLIHIPPLDQPQPILYRAYAAAVIEALAFDASVLVE